MTTQAEIADPVSKLFRAADALDRLAELLEGTKGSVAPLLQTIAEDIAEAAEDMANENQLLEKQPGQAAITTASEEHPAPN